MDDRVWQSDEAAEKGRLGFYPYWLLPSVNNRGMIVTWPSGITYTIYLN